MNLPQQPPQQQMTQEQLNQLLRRALIGEQHVQGLFGDNVSPQMRQQTLQQIVDAAVTEALTRAKLLHDGEFGKFRSEFDQNAGLLQELYREHSLGKFFGDYPQLKDYRQMVEDAVSEVSGLPEPAKDMKEFFSKVAQSAESRVRSLKPDFALPPQGGAAGAPMQQSPAAGTGVPQPTPPTYTGPSAPSGGGAGAGQPARKSGASDIWDDE
jgi:hypothetical protein